LNLYIFFYKSNLYKNKKLYKDMRGIPQEV